MRIEIMVAALALSLPAAAQQRGSINDIAGAASVAGGATEFTVSGRNPCGAVNLDYGDGQAITHPIRALPVTISHTYARAGNYQVRARGMGNCDGEASMTVRVTGGGRAETRRRRRETRRRDRALRRDGPQQRWHHHPR